MRKLLQPGAAQDKIEHRCPIIRQNPLLEEIRLVHAPKTEVKKTITEKVETRKQGLTARQYASALSLVMMLTGLLSQATALVGCVKSVVEGQKPIEPQVVTIEKVGPELDSQMNVSAAAVIQRQVNADAGQNVSAPVVNSRQDDTRSNQTIGVPNLLSNYSMP